MYQNLLDSSDQERLAQLLTDSQQSRKQERVSLCRRIGINPAELNFLDNSDITFSRMLIHHLISIGDEQALCQLCCQVLLPIFSHNKVNKALLNYFAEKLNCSRSLIRHIDPPDPQVRNITTFIKNNFINIISILGGIAGIIILISYLHWQTSQTNTSNSNPTPSQSQTPQIKTDNSNDYLKNKMSAGERLLAEKEGSDIPQEQRAKFTTAKKEGINRILNNGYNSGIAPLKEARSFYSNSPETLIYLNNANIIHQDQAYTIALAAPISQQDNYGLGVLRGVALAQQEINKNVQNNGLSQKFPIKIVLVDDRNLVDDSLANFLIKPTINISKINQDIRIVGLIGHKISDLTFKLGNIYNDNKLPVVSASSTSTDIFGTFAYVHPKVKSSCLKDG
ncbi:MAG: ABC transporter substrate-binding protein [Nostoc sp. DedQUE04]|uniref:ABC transporter substrate-binding protein n=1 Tax=Nostoc sp. DedQUE04 TaxID=3075390 RepID=UPI002AD49DA5|nr:ABC transporter substrate-binding protein [Nostoc sp. DedQUE04]MDZ8133752.1 ABC transporter substrate-binding protein [Nostoc sp. DedQUE04]